MSEQPVTSAAPSSKLRVLLLLWLLCALIALTLGREWLIVALREPIGGEQDLRVSGQQASGGVASLVLSAAAAGVALLLAGRVFRVVLGVLVALLGGCVVWAVAATLADPLLAAGPLLSERSGISGAASLLQLVDAWRWSFWPGVALGLGGALVLCGVAVVVLAPRWPLGGARYRAVRLVPVDDAGPSDGFENGQAAAAQPGAGEGSPSSTADEVGGADWIQEWDSQRDA